MTKSYDMNQKNKIKCRDGHENNTSYFNQQLFIKTSFLYYYYEK